MENSPASLAVSGFRVLVVDDFDLVKVMIRTTLTNLGIVHIDEAGDGRDALRQIREAHAANFPFQLVLCDWNMPVMNGIELLQMTRRSPEFERLPFIMITANAEQKQVFKALSNGALDYLVKPITPGSLEKKISNILKKIQKKAVA